MAEAAVEDRPNTRFFCHKCSVEFDSSESQDYTCPLCSGGFIEELEGSENQEDDSRSSEFSEALGFRGFPQNQRVSTLNDIREIRDLLTLVGGQMDIGNVTNITPAGQRPRSSRRNPTRRVVTLPERFDQQTYRPRSRFALVGRLGRPRATARVGVGAGRPTMENLITDVVLNLTGNQMFIVGNPLDYAWGREGLNTIVTQLLDQMDGTGPPPMPRERIVEIPTIPVTQEQVNQKLQCSVCWEDFQLDEPVRSLPCLHVYHEACICPWLELHATCPICRKSLTEEAAEAANNSTNTVSNGLAALFRQQSVQQQFDGPHDNLGDTIPITASQNSGSSRSVSSNNSPGPSNSGSTASGWQTGTVTNNASRPTRVTNDQYEELRDPYTGNLFADVELDMDIDFDFD